MVKETINCLVCGQPLRATGADVNMYYCARRKEWVSEFGIHLDIVDTVIYVDPDEQREIMWVVEIPPYRFTMTDFPSGPKTVVDKTIIPGGPPWDSQSRKDLEALGTSAGYRKLILTVPAIMKLAWNDKKQVLDRLKLYLLFS
jgi:hypothetical protein